jgi:hypothetical protein
VSAQSRKIVKRAVSRCLTHANKRTKSKRYKLEAVSRILNERSQDSAYFIDKEEMKSTSRSPGEKARKKGAYLSRTKRDAKHLAPATMQRETSALILFTTECAGDSLRSKIRLFLSFQISQLTRRTSDRRALRGVSVMDVTENHHSLVVVLGDHSVG